MLPNSNIYNFIGCLKPVLLKLFLVSVETAFYLLLSEGLISFKAELELLTDITYK